MSARTVSLVALLAAPLLTGCVTTPGGVSEAELDRFEKTNRAIYSFNKGVDTAVLKPVTQGYRAVVPGMKARGGGYLMNTASAAGLLTSLPSASYAVTKHAAVALAEWLAIQHGNSGIRVSVLCPQAVDTPLIAGRAGSSAARNDGVISADELADCVVAGMDAETFLILPHPQVLEYFQRKANGYDRWLNGMRRFAASLGVGRQP